MSDQTRKQQRVKRLKQSNHKNTNKRDRINKNSARCKTKTESTSLPISSSNYQNAVNYLKKQYRKCLAMLDEIAHLGESCRDDAMAHAELVDKRFDESKDNKF